MLEDKIAISSLFWYVRTSYSKLSIDTKLYKNNDKKFVAYFLTSVIMSYKI